MGPLVSTLNAVGPEINFTDTMLIPGLESFWYLAVPGHLATTWSV